MTDKKLRVGVIGLGFIAHYKHLPGLAAVADDVDIIAFCDFEEEKREKYIKEYGVEDSYTTDDWKKVVADESLDAVYVLTWNVSHAEITCAALEAGKHVLCEKPMAISSEEAEKMVETAKRTGKILTIGYQNRFRDDVQMARKAVDDGVLGDVYVSKAHAIRRRGVPTWGVFTDVEKQGGGPLIDIGTHALDLALWLSNNYEVDSVTGSVFHKIAEMPYGEAGSNFPQDNFSTEDSAFGYVKMKNGAMIFLEAAWAINFAHSREAAVTLAGTKGGVELDHDGDAVMKATINNVVAGRTVTTQPAATRFFSPGGSTASPEAVAEQKTFIGAIRDGKDLVVLPEQALVVTRVLEAIYNSAKSGDPVKF
ncbi:Gfo/Idh/MocA family protein [Aestuariimicrobium ganziense]|uniref:Gfo/Idh/MocA family protein n=1 Tax=Aestuariimicrobium ganziense TaxID=2773677 RepID=UPI001942C3F9|nr:Gfo/Idh/MocA family oxidoreductase [Aestuariimicrobium ganziense]